MNCTVAVRVGLVAAQHVSHIAATPALRRKPNG